MSYAQRTTVGQPATFNEIERTLKRYGATAFIYDIVYELARRIDALESGAQNMHGVELTETTLGERIRALRLERGMTLAEVVGQTGMSLSYLSDIERGKPNANPTVTTLRGIAEALGVSVAHLFANGDES